MHFLKWTTATQMERKENKVDINNLFYKPFHDQCVWRADEIFERKLKWEAMKVTGVYSVTKPLITSSKRSINQYKTHETKF